MKKYTVDYCSGATGFGWSQEYDRLDEFEGFINEMRTDFTARVIVYDNYLQDFIFWKNCLTYHPDIDLLHSGQRDMRTKTRMYN